MALSALMSAPAFVAAVVLLIKGWRRLPGIMPNDEKYLAVATLVGAGLFLAAGLVLVIPE